MASYPRLILQVAATAGIATVLSATSPVLAADAAVISPGASAVKMMPSIIKRHAVRRARIAVLDHDRRTSFISGNPDCSGIWCKRHFVLMVGIGY